MSTEPPGVQGALSHQSRESNVLVRHSGHVSHGHRSAKIRHRSRMRPADIVAAIKERGLRQVTGDAPEATVGANIYSSIKEDGENSPFTQTNPSEFAFNEAAKSAEVPPQPDDEAAVEDNEEESKKVPGIIARIWECPGSVGLSNGKSNPEGFRQSPGSCSRFL